MLSLFILACAAPDTADSAGGGDACARPGDTLVGVISALDFAHASDDGVSSGFNLDGVVTASGESTGCGVGDYTSPLGEPGVDNGFALMLPALEMTEAAAVSGLIQDAINSGELLIMLQIDGVEDPMNDACVDVGLGRGSGVPTLGTDGTLEWNQTLDHDPAFATQTVQHTAIVDGRLLMAPLETTIPITVLGVPLDFPLHDGALSLERQPDGSYRGALAGGVDTAYIQSVAETNNVDAALAGLMASLLALGADLSPAGDGTCEQISITFEFTAVPAFFFEESP